MQQLILNSIYLPEVKAEKYRCYESTLSQDVEMISGRVVKEFRGHVWIIEYTADYLNNALLRQVMQTLRGGASFECAFLPDNSSTMETGTFITTSINDPAFAFDRYGIPYWTGLSFTLREVAPHD